MRTETADPPPFVVPANDADEMASAARAYLLAVSYPSHGTEAALAASLAPGAELPSEARTIELLRQSNWCYPQSSDRSFRLFARERDIAVCFAFDVDTRLEQVIVIDLNGSPTSGQQRAQLADGSLHGAG